MNEHEQPHPPQAPTAAETQPSREEVRTVYLDNLEDEHLTASGESNVSVVREGIRRYGQSFLAHLILDGVDQREPDLIEQFERRFAGSHPDRESFTRWAIRDLGWASDLEELRHLQGLWPDDVRWDPDELWPYLTERYAITERLGGVHAFRR